jgi:hypothetical protein
MTRVDVSETRRDDPVFRALVLALARRDAGVQSGSSLVDWATEAMLAGWDATSLSVLAGLGKPPNEFEVDAYVTRLAAELKLELPRGDSRRDAHIALLAEGIVSGALSPYDGARELAQLYYAGGWPKALLPFSLLEDAFELARDGIHGCVGDVEHDILKEAKLILESSAW